MKFTKLAKSAINYEVLYATNEELGHGKLHTYKTAIDKKQTIEIAKQLFNKLKGKQNVYVSDGEYTIFDLQAPEESIKTLSKDYRQGLKDAKEDFEIGHALDPNDMGSKYSKDYINGYRDGLDEATDIFEKKSAVQQPNKPKPTTMLPDNMEWAWNPNAADWVAVMKDNTNVTPPLYTPNNQNIIDTNTTSYMSSVKSACLSKFLDGPRYSKEIKIEAGLIKEGLLKYAGFDFERGTKYIITDKGLEVLRKASEVEHNEAQNEREKLAYLFEFDTDKVDTLDTTGKVIKSDDIYSKFINDFRIQDYLKKCVKDGMLEGNKEVGSTLIDEDKYIGMFTSELKPVDFANFDTEKAKELLKQELAKIEKESGFFDKDAKYIKIESKKFTIHENNGDIIGEIEADNESDAKIKFGIEHPEYAESLSICAKEIDAQYEQTTNTKEPYPNPSETPNEQITLENHDGWVNTADQKVTPEFAQLHAILGEYKKAGHILNIFQEGNDLLVTASPIGSFEMKQQLEQLGYECEETDQSDTGDAYSMPTYTLRIKLK